jgi:hypothetical protein
MAVSIFLKFARKRGIASSEDLNGPQLRAGSTHLFNQIKNAAPLVQEVHSQGEEEGVEQNEHEDPTLCEEEEQQQQEENLELEGEGGAEDKYSYSEEEAEERYSGSEESDDVDEGKVDPKFQAELEEHVKMLNSEKEEDLRHSVAFFEKSLEDEYDPPVFAILDLNILPRCIQLLSSPKYAQLHMATAELLLDISYKECGQMHHTEREKDESRFSKAVVDTGGIPVLIEMVSSENLDLAEEVLRVLGNIISSGPKTRDHVVDGGIVPAVLKFASNASGEAKDVARTLSFLCMVLCKGEPPCNVQKITPLLGLMKGILTGGSHRHCAGDVCTALSHLSDGGDKASQIVFDLGVCPSMLKIYEDYMTGNPTKVAVLHTLKNIASVSDARRQDVVDLGVLEHFQVAADFLEITVQLELFRLLSVISAGTNEHKQRVIDCGWVQHVVKVLIKGQSSWLSSTLEEECCRCVCHVLGSGSPHQQRYVIALKCVPPLCTAVKKRNYNILPILDAFESLLKNTIGQPVNKIFVEALKECGGLDIIKETGVQLATIVPFNQIIPTIVEYCTKNE